MPRNCCGRPVRIYRIGASPEWQRSASCRPIRVLAPGTALELLPSRALPSAQVQGIVTEGERTVRETPEKQEGDMTNPMGAGCSI